MRAEELMTRDVVTVGPETGIAEIARVLASHAISAVPVVDNDGTLLGMVSEGDLLGRKEAERDARREWWLTMLAEGEALSAEFLASVNDRGASARDLMSMPVVSVAEATDASEIAQLLARHRIKRVPVLRDGKIVGIVSRADLLRALIADGDAAAG